MNTKQELLNFLEENYFAKIDPDSQIDEDEDFMEQGILDSTGILELVSFIEEKFGITVDDEDMRPSLIGSVNTLVKFIEGKQNVA